MIQYIMYRGL